MNFNDLNAEPKLMMSEGLEEIIPSDVNQPDGSVLFITLVPELISSSLIGILSGVEFGEDPKLDVRSNLNSAFDFIGHVLLDEKNRQISNVILTLGDKSLKIPGRYSINKAKIVDIDSENQMCILAIDLIKHKPVT